MTRRGLSGNSLPAWAASGPWVLVKVMHRGEWRPGWFRQVEVREEGFIACSVSQIGLLLFLLPALTHTNPSASISSPVAWSPLILSCLSLAVTSSRKPTWPPLGQVSCLSDVLYSSFYCSRAITPLCKHLPPNHKLCKDGALVCVIVIGSPAPAQCLAYSKCSENSCGREGGGEEDHLTCFSETFPHSLHCRIRYTLASTEGLYCHHSTISSNESGHGDGGGVSSDDKVVWSATDDNTTILHLWTT